MQPIDLRTAAPRTPRATAGGIVFLPRSIDKVRATLPGGACGDYRLTGLTATMLERFGISVEDFTRAVERAPDDDAVAGYVLANVAPDRIGAWNAFVNDRRTLGGDRALAEKHYPWLSERPDLVLALDVLAEDDRRTFQAEEAGR